MIFLINKLRKLYFLILFSDSNTIFFSFYLLTTKDVYVAKISYAIFMFLILMLFSMQCLDQRDLSQFYYT